MRALAEVLLLIATFVGGTLLGLAALLWAEKKKLTNEE